MASGDPAEAHDEESAIMSAKGQSALEERT